MNTPASPHDGWKYVERSLLLSCLLGASILMLFLYAPTEATMGHAQRTLYLHVSVAWCGLAGSLGMGLCGAAYLVRRRLTWDHRSQALAEVSWLCISLTLVTGSLWAHEAWGVWWTWEPRLTSALVLWLIYVAMFLVRAGIEEPQRRARVGAVLAILAVCDIPMVLLATRWFRGVHPVAPEMDGRMRLTLVVTAVSFTCFFAFCTWQRRRQLGLAERIAVLEARAEPSEA